MPRIYVAPGGLFVAALLLSACGGPSAEQPSGGSQDSQMRTVTHLLGSTEVPVDPQRIATLSEGVAGHLASTGLLVVAAPDDVPEWLTPYQERFAPELDLDSISQINTSEEPDLEALALAEPDLIIIENFSEDLYPELSEIAPTVVVERPSNADWQQAFAQTVEFAGREEEAAPVRASYEAALAEVPPEAANVEVACMRADDDGSFRLDGWGAFCGSVAAEAGYPVTAAPGDLTPGPGGFVEMSGERLPAITGDLIVAQTDAADVDTITGFTQNPLWSTLPAVQSDSVITLPNPIYNNGTYYAAELLLEAINEAAVRGAR